MQTLRHFPALSRIKHISRLELTTGTTTKPSGTTNPDSLKDSRPMGIYTYSNPLPVPVLFLRIPRRFSLRSMPAHALCSTPCVRSRSPQLCHLRELYFLVLQERFQVPSAILFEMRGPTQRTMGHVCSAS